jgi:hypothetical protein
MIRRLIWFCPFVGDLLAYKAAVIGRVLCWDKVLLRLEKGRCQVYWELRWRDDPDSYVDRYSSRQMKRYLLVAQEKAMLAAEEAFWTEPVGPTRVTGRARLFATID